MILTKDLIQLGLDVQDRQGALTVLTEKLRARGLIREGFLDSLLAREAAYPTGLRTAIPTALYHTDAQFVVQSALAVGVLRHPVAFREMGTPEDEVMVEIVFLLAIDDPEMQVATLQRLVLLMKDRAALETIRDASDAAGLAEFLKSWL
jgi:PTS system galactitol-specific IIA component